MTITYGYQDSEYEVVEVRGKRLESLLAFYVDGKPNKLLGRFDDGDCCEAFLAHRLVFRTPELNRLKWLAVPMSASTLFITTALECDYRTPHA